LIPLAYKAHDRSHSWIGIDTSIKSGGVELVLWAQTSPLNIVIRKEWFSYTSRLA